jgi:hypothetical protein
MTSDERVPIAVGSSLSRATHSLQPGGYSRILATCCARYGSILGALISEWVNSDRMLTSIGEPMQAGCQGPGRRSPSELTRLSVGDSLGRL